MLIKKVPLTETEKKLLKKVLIIRIVLGVIFLTPLITGLAFFTCNSVISLLEKNYELVNFICIIISAVSCYLLYKFVVPFYKNTLQNVEASNKLVIETYILSVKERYTTKGMHYIVATENLTIDSWHVAILSSSLPFNEMKVNMKIKIYQLENNRLDVLYIEKI